MLYFWTPSTRESGNEETKTAQGVRNEEEGSDTASSATNGLDTAVLLTL